MRSNRIHEYAKIYFLFFLTLMCFFILSGCGSLFSRNQFNASLFEKILITDQNNHTVAITEDTALSFWIEAFNYVKTDNMNISAHPLHEYQVTLEGKKEKHTQQLFLYVESLDNQHVYIMLGDKPGIIGSTHSAAILSHPVFDPLYDNRIPPEVYIMEDSGPTKLEPVQYEWQFQKADRNYYETNLKHSEQDIIPSFTISDDCLPDISTNRMPDNMKWDISKDNEVIFTTSGTKDRIPALKDGSYPCHLELYWFEDDQKNDYGSVTYRFNIEIDNPPEFDISTNRINPGELLVIKAYNINEDQKVSVTTDIDFTPHVFGTGPERTILLPISYYHQDGRSYSITVSAGSTSETFDVELMKKDFITQYLTIDEKTAAETRNDKSAQEVVDKVSPIRPMCDDEQYWEGPFIQPVEGGRVSPTDFGKRRYVNNAPTSYRHNGLDIGQDEGTPIKAVNHGRVLLADYLIGTGYTVIIEHGYGLKSWYYHMVSLNTKAGERVQKGDIIGLVGSTGFSTGPHLHLSISVNHVYVNPMPFFEEGVPLTGQTN